MEGKMRKLSFKIALVMFSLSTLVIAESIFCLSNTVATEEKGAERIEALIKSLESKDFETRNNASSQIVSLGNQTLPSLLNALPEAPVSLKGQIIFILGRIGDKGAAPLLIEILKSKNAYIRRNAVEALGKIKDESALSALSASLFDDDGSVRQRAAWALGELDNPEGVEALLNRLADEKEERVRIAVVKALAKLKDKRATLILLEKLALPGDQLYKNELVTALGEIGDLEAMPELTDYTNRLKGYHFTEEILIFQREQAIKIAEEAMQKIENRNDDF